MRRFDHWLARWAKLIPLAQPSLGRVVAIAALTLIFATGLRFLITPLLGDTTPFVTYFPAVLIAAVWGHLVCGVLVLIGSALFANLLWFYPVGADPAHRNWVVATVVFLVTGGLEVGVATMLRLALTSAQQGRHEAEMIAHEMRHRVNNLLTLVQSLALQTARSSETLYDFRRVFEQRLQAVSRAQSLALPRAAHPSNFLLLIEAVLDPFERSRFSIDGPDILLPGEAITPIALLVHELCTNAVKYGALSNQSGKVFIEWTFEGTVLYLTWKERGGPPVSTPTRKGFGTKLATSIVPPELGSASILFDPDGVRCQVEMRLGSAH